MVSSITIKWEDSKVFACTSSILWSNVPVHLSSPFFFLVHKSIRESAKGNHTEQPKSPMWRTGHPMLEQGLDQGASFAPRTTEQGAQIYCRRHRAPLSSFSAPPPTAPHIPQGLAASPAWVKQQIPCISCAWQTPGRRRFGTPPSQWTMESSTLTSTLACQISASLRALRASQGRECHVARLCPS
jgi:hypothetical protein